MRKCIQFSFITLLLTLGLFSCGPVKKTTPTEQKNEIFVEQDAKLPAGYRPNYIKALEYFRIDTSINYQTRIIHSDTKNGRTRIFFNIEDNWGKLYVHANDIKWKKAWCTTEEKTGQKAIPLKNHQIIHSTEKENVPNAFAFVLDHSASMGDQRIFTVQNAIFNLASNDKKPEDAFSVVKFADQAVKEVPLIKDPDKFVEQFKFTGLPGNGNKSALNDAINLAIDELDTDASFRNKVLVVFTDGIENGSQISKEDLIKKLIAKGIMIFTIDFGTSTDANYMSDLAAQSGGFHYHIYRTSEFNSIFQDIYKRIKNCYSIDYTPSTYGNQQFRMVLCNQAKKTEMLYQMSLAAGGNKHISINIAFDPGKSSVKSNYKTEIDRIATIMKENPGKQFEIQSHTDDAGDAKVNLSLSQKRADAIKAELIKKGISQELLIAKGMGESLPIADNKTKEGKILNRRTELVLVN